MRYSLLLLPVLLVFGACMRENTLATPYRGGHAWHLRGGGNMTAGAASTTYRLPPRAGEKVITLGPEQKLWMVAEDYGVDLHKLIERNDFTRNPYPGPGTKVIVPDMIPASER